jgi:hypothetical protein
LLTYSAQGLKIFGDPVLLAMIMSIYFGAKHISAKDMPIGLRWMPCDKKIPLEIFPYAGMLVSLLNFEFVLI